MKKLMFFALAILMIGSFSSCTDKKITIVDNRGNTYEATVAPATYHNIPDTGEYVSIMKDVTIDLGDGYIYSGRNYWSHSDSTRIWGLFKKKIVYGKVIASTR
ncbi:MAG: hypothetical protein KBB70_01115 [Candidatus Pacebacteria bacterium]|jgi:CTP:phosphocholine cytidylyltransferase-like protein|nr:hypothetical protein [Candidatus Paceibacterota bacterium]